MPALKKLKYIMSGDLARYVGPEVDKKAAK